jgi:hypothetical protein
MVVPSLPVVSYLTSSIGLLVTVHAAIDRVLLDLDQTKSYGQNLVNTRLQLRKVSESLQDWAKLWFMTEETPEELRKSLSAMYWGERTHTICLSFDDVQHAWCVLKEQLISILPTDGADVNSWNRRLSDATSLQQIRGATASERKVLQSKTSLIEKAWVGNFKLEPFKRQLEVLEKRMSDLETDSHRVFKKHNAITNDSDVDQRRRSIEHEAYLVSMAQSSGRLADMLLRRCEALSAFSADIHINQVLEASPAQRVEFLSQWAHKRLASYCLQVTAKAEPNKPDVGLILTQSPNFDSKKIHYDLEGGVRIIENAREPAELVSLFLKDAAGDTEGFVLEMRKQKLKSHKKESLTSFITPGKPRSGAKPARKLRETEKIALSLYLVESAMLVVSLGGFSNICTCILQQVKMESVGLTYTLRLQQSHTPIQPNEVTQPACLHHEAVEGSPLQRLGFTLAEIALGKEIERGEEQEEEALLELEKTPWARLLYTGAVQYCLSFPNEYSQDLQTFYESVVEP